MQEGSGKAEKQTCNYRYGVYRSKGFGNPWSDWGNSRIIFQIMSLDPADVLINNIKQTIGTERGKYYWNRRKMQDSGMNLSGATDLPLLLTSIPESIYYSCGGYMDGRAEAFQSENTLTVPELLKAWTIGGQKNLGMEEVLGTLEEGKLADITVFDRNLLGN